MRIVWTVLLLSCVACAGSAAAPDAEPAPAQPEQNAETSAESEAPPPAQAAAPIPEGMPQALAERIDTAIALLEQERYKEFIETTASPDDIAKILEQTTLEELSTRFGQEKAGKALDALKQARSMSPKPIEDGAAMHFDTQPRNMEFELVNGTWYMRN